MFMKYDIVDNFHFPYSFYSCHKILYPECPSHVRGEVTGSPLWPSITKLCVLSVGFLSTCRTICSYSISRALQGHSSA